LLVICTGGAPSSVALEEVVEIARANSQDPCSKEQDTHDGSKLFHWDEDGGSEGEGPLAEFCELVHTLLT
jgi:hypothetical protein